MIQITNTPEALTLFAESALKHAEATEQGNYRIANKCYSSIVKTVTFLKEQKKIQSLSELLNHDSVGVRLWAATYLLPVLEDDGIRVLEQIAGASGIHSFTAKTTLSEWRKGDLKL